MHFLFSFHHLTLVFLFFKKKNLEIFFILFSIRLSRSHELDNKFDGLTWVDSILINYSGYRFVMLIQVESNHFICHFLIQFYPFVFNEMRIKFIYSLFEKLFLF
jgi:hypothetical protein